MKIIEKITESRTCKKALNIVNVLALHVLVKRKNTPATNVPIHVKILSKLGIKYSTFDYGEFVRGIPDEHLCVNPSKEVIITTISYRYFMKKIMGRYANDSLLLYIVVNKEKYDVLLKLKNTFYISHRLHSRNNIRLIFEKKDYTKLKLMGTFDI